MGDFKRDCSRARRVRLRHERAPRDFLLGAHGETRRASQGEVPQHNEQRAALPRPLLSHRPMTAGYREPEYVSENMNALLSLLHRVADVFARSFLLVVEDIPRVFGMVLKP